MDLKKTLSEQIYEILRNDILTQAIPCGSKLTLKILQERFQVSSTPIREALTRLTEEQLASSDRSAKRKPVSGQNQPATQNKPSEQSKSSEQSKPAETTPTPVYTSPKSQKKPELPDCGDYESYEDFMDDWDGYMPDGSDAEDYWEDW